MACKGCAKRRQVAASAVKKVYARAQILRDRMNAKRKRLQNDQ